MAFYCYYILMERLGFYINKKMYYVIVDRTKNKNMYLKVKGDDLIVSAPRRVSKQTINEFVTEHIEKFVEYIENKKTLELYSLKENYVYYLGKKYPIVSLTGFPKSSSKIMSNNIYINTQNGSDDEVIQAIKDFIKKDTFKYISKNIKKFEKSMNLGEHIVKVRYKTSNWGVNKVGTNTLSFTSRLSHFRREVTDYLIVHELAHSIEPNHSPAFWNIVGQQLPNYKEIREELKDDKTLNE